MGLADSIRASAKSIVHVKSISQEVGVNLNSEDEPVSSRTKPMLLSNIYILDGYKHS